MEAECPGLNRHCQGRLQSFRRGTAWREGWRGGQREVSLGLPSPDALAVFILGEEAIWRGADRNDPWGERGVRSRPPPRKIWGPLHAHLAWGPRRGAVLTVCAAQASSSSSDGGGGHSSKRGRMVPGALPGGRLDGRPPVRNPRPGSSAPSAGARAPAGRRVPRSHGRATQPAASGRTASPRKRWPRVKPPSPLIRTRRCRRSSTQPRLAGGRRAGWQGRRRREGAGGRSRLPQAQPGGGGDRARARCLSLRRCNAPRVRKERALKFWGGPAATWLPARMAGL